LEALKKCVNLLYTRQLGNNSFQKSDNYTWYHMDDFEYVNGKVYYTMQLVETLAHSAKGMTHSGSVAQHKAFGLGGY
jgi:A nuclease of the HNH/ENDO VII superfamily with conserved WHH